MIYFNDFRFRVGTRVVLIGLVMALFTYMIHHPNMILAAVLTGGIILLQVWELYRFSSRTNQKLTRFLESIKYSDFISSFNTDNKLGKSFRNLNIAFNEVLEAFRKARSEREEHWLYLNSVVQQVKTGILSFDTEGNVQLINTYAKHFIGIQNIKNIDELLDKNPRLYKAIFDATAVTGMLYKGPRDLHLSIQASEMRMRGNTIKLVTIQNIQPELQRQELEAWQNLTRVLRHEIMNSITPISSLTSTLKDILAYDIVQRNGEYQVKNESMTDLKEGLTTIENRSKGLIRFIDAYREYTSLPQPRIHSVRLKELIDKVAQLMIPEMRRNNIVFTYHCVSEYLTIQADFEMVEQVIINLVKNAIEAVQQTDHPAVELAGFYDTESVIIEVKDNGPGIIREALEQIFVPFYTTKTGGSGIGLSLSRQIMQMHHGTLTVESEPVVQTSFLLRF